MSTTLPLVAHPAQASVLAYRAGVALRVGQFHADVRQLEAQLGATRHVLNACADRYQFAVGLAACVISGRVSLLPSTHTPAVIHALRGFAPDAICLTDSAACSIDLPQLRYPTGPAAPSGSTPLPQIPADRLVAYVFTSGSTGTPVPYRKTWGRLVRCVQIEAQRLGLEPGVHWSVLATVPPQHMYGLESSVLMCLAGGHALCAERPFYPADIAACLAQLPRPRALITTPVHLRALVSFGEQLPAIDLIVSATAPLTQQLALEAERRFGAPLREIYGSTETGEIAARRPTQGAEWQLWPGVRFSEVDGETWADGGHIEQPTRLCDVIEVTGPERFLLHGRVADLVNIAGKRSSLAYLNHQLNSIDGVLDGVFFHADAPAHGEVVRVGACVVAPQLDARRLMRELRQRIDPVFLPRPLLFVAQLPRNDTGKLPREALQALAAAHARTSAV
ncbi:MAG: acyl-CoA synthetase [Gammaproteobacteria bacterium]|nr:acyl-CoA synthetase [Gammaproteobacteria bacterium]